MVARILQPLSHAKGILLGNCGVRDSLSFQQGDCSCRDEEAERHTDKRYLGFGMVSVALLRTAVEAWSFKKCYGYKCLLLYGLVHKCGS